MISVWLLFVVPFAFASSSQAQEPGDTEPDDVPIELDRCVLRWRARTGLDVHYNGQPVFLAYPAEMTVHTRDWTTAYYRSSDHGGRVTFDDGAETKLLVIEHDSGGFSWRETIAAGPGDSFRVEYVYRQDLWEDAALQLGFSRPVENWFAGNPFETDAPRKRGDGRIPTEYDPGQPHPLDSATHVTVQSLFGKATIETTKPVSLYDYEQRNGTFWLGLDEPLPKGEEQSFAIDVHLEPARLDLPGLVLSDLALPTRVETGRLEVKGRLHPQDNAPPEVQATLVVMFPDGERTEQSVGLRIGPDKPTPVDVGVYGLAPGKHTYRLVLTSTPQGQELFASPEMTAEVLPVLSATPGRSIYTTEAEGCLLVRATEALAYETLRVVARAKGQEELTAPVPPGGRARLPVDLAQLPEGVTEFEVALRPVSGEAALGTVLCAVRKARPKPNEVKIDYESRGLIVEGLPWFPFGFYCVFPPGDLPGTEAPQGFNMIAPYQSWPNEQRADHYDEIRTYLDRCAAVGMKVHYDVRTLAQSEPSDAKWQILRREIETFRDHPALLTWYLCDEPAGQGIPPERLKEGYDFIKDLDPYHPITMVFCVPDRALDYADAMDILMADPYPIPNHPVTMVSDWADKLDRAVNESMPLWIVPQAFGGGEGWRREPSAREERAMTYLALTHGATGIQYFIRRPPIGNPISPNLWSECRRLALEVNELAPVLLSTHDRPDATCSSAHIHLTTRRHRGADYLVAVNAINTPLELDFTLEGDYNGDAAVLFEGRTVRVTDGRWTDIIDGFGTRVYRVPSGSREEREEVSPGNLTVNPSFEEAVNVGTPDGCYLTVGEDHGASILVDPRLAYHGSHSLRLTTPTEGQGVTVAPFPVPVQEGRTYAVSVWARSRDPGGQFELGVSRLEPGSERFELTTEWSKYEFSGVAKGDGRATMSLRLVSRGIAWFDLLQVVPQ